MPPRPQKTEHCSITFDRSFAAMPLCGVDEAGRGPLAGPVVAACIHIPDDLIAREPDLRRVRDSKTLKCDAREAIFDLLTRFCAFGVGRAEVAEINAVNILNATMNAMTRAVADMETRHGVRPALVLIDGNRLPRDLPAKAQAVVRGDSLSLCIGAASIIAKVTRDRFMREIAREYPAYGWHSNAGYGTPAHLSAISSHGPSPYHRMSFAPMRANDDDAG